MILFIVLPAVLIGQMFWVCNPQQAVCQPTQQIAIFKLACELKQRDIDHRHSTAYSGCDCRSLSAWNFPTPFSCDPGQSLTISTFVFVFDLCIYNSRLHCKLFIHPQIGGYENRHHRYR